MLNGYRLLYRPKHPRSMKNLNWNGYVYEYIMLAEEMMGRSLTEKEVVHHLDGNRSNNRIANLLVPEESQHKKLHAWINSGAPGLKELGKKGLNSGKPKLVGKNKTCIHCGKTLQLKQKNYCSDTCAKLCIRSVERPSYKELLSELDNNSYVSVGKSMGLVIIP